MILHMQGSDAQAMKAHPLSSPMTKLDFLYAMKWSAGDESPFHIIIFGEV